MHKLEIETLTKASNELLANASSINEELEKYQAFHAEVDTAFIIAYEGIKSQVDALVEQESQAEARKKEIAMSRATVLGALGAAGVHWNFAFDGFDGWRDHLREAYLDIACAARGIRPNNRPEKLPVPQEPAALVVVTERTVKERWSIYDAMVFLAGGAFGSAAAGAIGAISFDSDGWHVSGMFWLMLAVGMAVSFMVGKTFTRLHSIIQLDTVDVYPYLDWQGKEDEMEGLQEAARKAKFIMGLPFVLFVLTDGYGWYRVITEQNASKLGDDGAILLNPYVAGAAVAFLTVLLMAAKCIASGSVVNERKMELVAEVKRNDNTYQNQMTRYKVEVNDYNASVGVAERYDELMDGAQANATYRMQQPSAAELTSLVDSHQRLVSAESIENEDAEERLQQLADQALEQVKEPLERFKASEAKIDTVHRQVREVTKVTS